MNSQTGQSRKTLGAPLAKTSGNQTTVDLKVRGSPSQNVRAGLDPFIRPTPTQGNTTGGRRRNGGDFNLLSKKEQKRLIREELGVAKVRDTSGAAKMVKTVDDCLVHYVSAAADPWGAPSGACLPAPQGNIFPSGKWKVHKSGTVVLGTTGQGYIALLPAWGNNSANLVCTSATSVGTSATFFSSYTNLQTYSFADLPYPASDFGDLSPGSLQGRFVTGGIRLGYIGELQNQNGVATAYCDSEHSSVTDSWSGDLLNEASNKVDRIITGAVLSPADRWLIQTVDNGPAVNAEYEFVNESSYRASPYMIIYIDGKPGDKYHYEAVMHVEIDGTLVMNKTASHASNDYPVVETVRREINDQMGPIQRGDEKSFLSRIKDGIMETLPKFLNSAGGLIPTVVKGLTMLVPTGANIPTIADQGFSYPMLMAKYEKIKTGRGPGTNIRGWEEAAFSKRFFRAINQAVDNDMVNDPEFDFDLEEFALYCYGSYRKAKAQAREGQAPPAKAAAPEIRNPFDDILGKKDPDRFMFGTLRSRGNTHSKLNLETSGYGLVKPENPQNPLIRAYCGFDPAPGGAGSVSKRSSGSLTPNDLA